MVEIFRKFEGRLGLRNKTKTKAPCNMAVRRYSVSFHGKGMTVQCHSTVECSLDCTLEFNQRSTCCKKVPVATVVSSRKEIIAGEN